MIHRPTERQIRRLHLIGRGFATVNTVSRKGLLAIKGIDRRLYRAGLIRATWRKDTAWSFPWDVNKKVTYYRELRITALGLKTLDVWS